MRHCPLCLRQIAGPIPTGMLPICQCCAGQLSQLPPKERMPLATAVTRAIEASRYNDVIHMLAIQLGELVDAIKGDQERGA